MVLFILTPLLISFSSIAAIKVTNVAGASNFDLKQSPAVIYGGTSGVNCSADADSTYDTCDSCAGLTGFEDCNTTRIYPGLKLRIYFQSDTMAGVAYLQNKDGTNITLSPVPTTKAKGETHVIEVPWSDVCSGASATTTDCEGVDITGSLFVGVDSSTDDTQDEAQVSVKVHDPDPNDTGEVDTIDDCAAPTVTSGGICDFTAYPGDGKIYITELGKSSGFPTSGNISIRALRFFVGSEDDPGGFVSSPSEGFTQDLDVTTDSSGNPETTSRVIEGASNGVLHFLRVATVDQANNVARFTSDAAIATECTSVATPSDGCIFTAKPDEVLGMLDEDFNCFIATAAYGSNLDSRLNVFRKFRSDILLKLEWGKLLVHSYYKWGPYAAAWMQDHTWSQPLVRVALWPLLGFAWLANAIGIGWTFTLLALVLLISIRQIRRWVQRDQGAHA